MDTTESLADKREIPEEIGGHKAAEKVPYNFAPSPDFLWLCEELFLRIEDVQRRGREHLGNKPVSVRYYEVISHFVKLWRKTVGNNIYPALVLSLPYRDKRVYNIKDYTLVKAVCSYLALPKRSATEKRLLKWKRRASRGVRLSNFCVEEIRKRKSESVSGTRITIDKLNECLDRLVEERNARGGFKGLSESPTFNFCLRNMSFLELRYFFDILLKNRVVGGQEHKLLNCWHPDAQDYLSVVSDLETVATRLWDPEQRLKRDDLNINLGYAFVPQLAKKMTISYEKISAKLNNDFLIEEKMDGERIQVHFMEYGNKIKFLSRRGVDYTHLYGENIKSGTVANCLQFDSNVRDCVLDGEMVTFDTDRDVVLPFGMVKSSARQALTTEGICSQDHRPMLMVLDLVYLNGVSLIKLPLYQRKEYLSKVLKPSPRSVEILPSVHCFDHSAIRKSLEKSIAMGSEGVVLKYYKARYEIGARRDSWIKIKPEYLEQFGENLDLVIIGRDPGKKDSLMCGLAVYEGEENLSQIKAKRESAIVHLDSDGEELDDVELKKSIKYFISFCVIANGISQDEFKEIDRRTRGAWTKSDQRLPSINLLRFGSKVPEEWIDPKQSVIIEVKARSLDNTESTGKKFAAGCTLHGGYCRRIRDDKDWTVCYSFSDLCQERLDRSTTVGSFNKRYSKARSPKKRSLHLFTNPSNKEISFGESTTIFRGLQFYVMSDFIDADENIRITKSELNDLIIQNSGKVVRNLISKSHNESLFRIISGRYTGECKALIQRGYDVINPQWILDCIRSNAVVKLEPRHCFNVSNELMAVARERVDEYGDSYVNSITKRQLENLFRLNLSKEARNTTNNTQLDGELFGVPLFLFYGRNILIPEGFFGAFDRSNLASMILLHGGSIAGDISSCDLIVVSKDASILSSVLLKDLRLSVVSSLGQHNSPPTIPHIVTTDWVQKSIEENSQVPEEDFVPPRTF